jgi:drug/metabolite transporter (DMT)-like permease
MPNPATTSAQRLGMILGFLGVVSFSLTLPLTRIAVTELAPLQLSIWRGIAAALSAIIILAIVRPPIPRGREWGVLVLCALGTVSGFPVFISLAMQTISAAHGAVVVGLLPLATAVFGVVIGDERPSPLFWGMSVLGTALTVGFVLRQSGGALEFGHIYLGLAVISAGMGYAFGGRLARRLRGWVVACWTVVVALPFLLVAANFVPMIPATTSSGVMLAFTYLALISQLGGFFFWYQGMALAGIARVSQLQLMQLFLTVAVSVVFLHEPWSLEVLIFGAGVAASVWATTRLRVGRKLSPR